jgi:sugar lactone lactonase YvrE
MLPIAVALGLAACQSTMSAGRPAPGSVDRRLEPGDYVITQESPAARQAARSRTAGSAVFLLKASGQIERLASPPAVSGPRGIRQDRDGSVIFADTLAPAIRRITPDGTVETVYAGSPLEQPKDIALDQDGGYVIADFASFKGRPAPQILKLSAAGTITTVYSGAPLTWPHGIAVDGRGRYVIADHSCCVYRLTPGARSPSSPRAIRSSPRKTSRSTVTGTTS